jgi:transcriptional regulatory protein LEU3
MDDEDHIRMMPPTLFVRLRQEMAASRINKLLYSANSHRFADSAATTYMTLEADRLKEERGSLDGVDNGKPNTLHSKLQANLQRTRVTLPLRCVLTPPPLLVLQS